MLILVLALVVDLFGRNVGVGSNWCCRRGVGVGSKSLEERVVAYCEQKEEWMDGCKRHPVGVTAA